MRWMTPQEVMEALQVSRQRLQQLRRAKTLKTVTWDGRQWLYDAREVEVYAEWKKSYHALVNYLPPQRQDDGEWRYRIPPHLLPGFEHRRKRSKRAVYVPAWARLMIVGDGDEPITMPDDIGKRLMEYMEAPPLPVTAVGPNKQYDVAAFVRAAVRYVHDHGGFRPAIAPPLPEPGDS